MKTPFLLALVPFLTTAHAAVIQNDATIGTHPAFPIDRAFTVTSAQESSCPPTLTATSADRYGWARVTNAEGKLIVTASATADSGGIFVGTLDQIPEPASTSLLATSLAALCLHRNRTRRPF